MARQFNGTSDYVDVALNLSSYNRISISFWGYVDSYSNVNKLLYDTYTNGLTSGCAMYIDNGFTGGLGLISMRDSASGGLSWDDSFIRPSAAGWHLFVSLHDRTVPSNQLWIDNSSIALTNRGHDAGFGGNFINGTVSMMVQNALAAGFVPGRMEDFSIWGGYLLTSGERTALFNGRRARLVQPTNLVLNYWMNNAEIDSAVAEADASGSGNTATVNGTTYVASVATLDSPVLVTSISAMSGVESREVLEAATTPSVTTFSGTDLLVQNVDSVVFNPKTAFSIADTAQYIETGLINPKTTFSVSQSYVTTDSAVFNPITAFTGLDHYCIYVPEFTVTAQEQYQIDGTSVRSNYQLDVAKRFSVVGSFNPGLNPC